jgi:hypothetical protein
MPDGTPCQKASLLARPTGIAERQTLLRLQTGRIFAADRSNQTLVELTNHDVKTRKQPAGADARAVPLELMVFARRSSSSPLRNS